MKRIYLDNCSLQRPLDDRSQPKINIEAEAILTILHMVENGQLNIVTSEILEYETGYIPDKYRQEQVFEMLKLADERIVLETKAESLAHRLVQAGVKPMDALHAASAEVAKVDYFCSSDDRLVKKLKSLSMISIDVVSPLELATEVMP